MKTVESYYDVFKTHDRTWLCCVKAASKSHAIAKASEKFGIVIAGLYATFRED